MDPQINKWTALTRTLVPTCLMDHSTWFFLPHSLEHLFLPATLTPTTGPSFRFDWMFLVVFHRENPQTLIGASHFSDRVETNSTDARMCLVATSLQLVCSRFH